LRWQDSSIISANPPYQACTAVDSTRIERNVRYLHEYPVKSKSRWLDRPVGELPFYDSLDNVHEVVWRLGYFKPYLMPLAPPSSEIALWQASMEAYVLSILPPMEVKKPFTRVRFDQSSRRTQLLAVDHVQQFSPRAGFRGAYRRRTRTGEYLGQTTDHYSAGFVLYGESRSDTLSALRLYGITQVLWNQLYDEINGGIVYDPAQGVDAAFQKESQPVRFTDGQWRLWHRLVKAEGGLTGSRKGAEWAVGLQAQVRQTYGGWRSGPARQPTSPFGTDTFPASTFAFGEEQRMGLRTALSHSALSLYLLRWWGRGKDWQAFDKKAFVLQAKLSFFAARVRYAPTITVFYRYWLSPLSPAPELTTSLSLSSRDGASFPSSVSLQYGRMALPWFFYQAYPLSRPRNPESLLASYTISWTGLSRDTLQNPEIAEDFLRRGLLRLSFWGMRQRWPLLIRGLQTHQSETPIFWYGVRFYGYWEGRHAGVYPGILFQRSVAPETLRWWTRQIPALTGWMQVHYRWRIPPFSPVYRLGMRLRGSTDHHPPQFEPAYALFFASDDTPLQPAWAAVDIFLTIHLRQICIYLRVDHAAEGLPQAGSFWTFPYPVPGRAFSFGFVWDIYN